MKKLNRKGFTLVELLAVIIILAIVVGITIPAVLTTTNNAKKKAMTTAASSAADWIDRQYQVYITGIGVGTDSAATLDANFTSTSNCGTDITNCKAEAGKSVDENFMTAAGLKPTNISGMTVFINSKTGRSCVKLTTAATGTNKGDYPDGAIACGGVCTETQCKESF